MGTQCVSSLFLDLLSPLSTTGVEKVIISLVPHLNEPTLEKLGTIVKIKQAFEFDSYWELDPLEGKRTILDHIYSGLLAVCAVYEWDSQIVRRAYSLAIDCGIVNYKLWRKPVANVSKNWFAQIYTLYEQDKVDLGVVVTSSNGELICKKQLVTLMPHDLFIDDALGRLEWICYNKVQLTSKDKKQKWAVTISQE